MPRKILVVDASQVMRTIIRTTIQSNLSDVVVLETHDGQEAVAQIKKEKCDLILSSWELPVLDGVELFWKIREIPGRQNIPFVLLTSKQEDKQHKLIKDSGIKYCLRTPFKPQELVEIINRFCDPISLRTSTRYSIPGAEVEISQSRKQYLANMVNISEGGMLCDMDLAEAYKIRLPVVIAITFPPDFENLVVRGLHATMVNLNVLAHGVDHIPEKVRIAYKFILAPADAQQTIQKVFNLAAAQEKQKAR
ncbi:MAG: response regulator [Desulfobulbaceae bacterium]|nr:response regulator [Desulfobulbaceae bacterium]